MYELYTCVAIENKTLSVMYQLDCEKESSFTTKKRMPKRNVQTQFQCNKSKPIFLEGSVEQQQ